jgi:hypothetical protein
MKDRKIKLKIARKKIKELEKEIISYRFKLLNLTIFSAHSTHRDNFKK